MTAWSSLRRLLGTGRGRRAPAKASFRPTLEQLECRNAPGSLLTVGGLNSLSLLGSSTSTAVTKASGVTGSGAPQPAPVSQASGTTAAANTVAVKSSGSGESSQSPTGDSSKGAPVSDPFVDILNPKAADQQTTTVVLPTAPPPTTSTDTQGDVTSPPSAGTAPPRVQAATFTASNDDTFQQVVDNMPTVQLTAPAFIGSQGAQVVVQAQSNGAAPLNAEVDIDVDLRHDGTFADPGDLNFAVGQLGVNGTATVSMPSLPAYGVYTIRARVSDTAGDVGFSAEQSVVADPNAGYVGSQSLLDLAYGVPYGSPLPQGGGENGPPHGSATAANFPFLVFDNQGRVLVNVHSTLTQYLSGLQSDLETQFGFTTTLSDPAQNMLTGWLPVNQILNLPNLANFASVTPVYKPQLSVGSYPTDGDPVIHADTFRAKFGVDGTGVKVGVMSDSVNEFGGGLAQSQATGDVAANVQVLADDPNGNGTDEGRAMLEIVHHIAPGAAEAFNTAEGGPQAMANGIQALVGVGARAITDDVTYFDEPMFNDGVIAQSAESAVNQGVLYTTSANNNANHAYLANWNPITATVGGVNGTFQNIQGGSALQTFTLGVGDTVTLSFQWDAAFLEGGSPGNGTGNFKMNNDMQVLVTDAAGNALAGVGPFDANATNTNEAFAFVQFTNTGGFGTNNFAFSFNLKSGANPTMIRWVSLDDGNPAADPHALLEGGPASFGHEVATGVVTTGAVDFRTPTTPEPFTAQGGPIPILFDRNGVRLASPDIRNEPIVAAPDGVQTSFFGQPIGAGFFFFGTSAATPHVAAAAALLMQQSPTATNADVAQYLEVNAEDIFTPGRDNLTGFGLIQLNGPLVVASQTSFENESNQTSERAANFGLLASGQTTTINDEGILPLPDGRNDYDWYRWTAAQAGIFSASEQTTSGGNTELHLFTLRGNTLVQLASAITAPAQTNVLSTAVAAGQVILVEVKGEDVSFGTMTQAVYNLTATMA